MSINNPNTFNEEEYLREIGALAPTQIQIPEALPAGSFANQAPAPTSSMEQRSGNILGNFINEARQIGTGLNYMGTHLGDIPYIVKDYINSGATIGDVITDVGNLVYEPYNIDFRKLQGRSIGDIALGGVVGAYTNPLSATLDAISFGGGRLAGQALSNLPFVGRGAKAGKVEEALAEQGAKVAKDTVNLEEQITKADRLAKESGYTLEGLIEAAETGIDIPKEAKNAFKALREFSDKYDDLAKAYSPSTYLGKENTAIVQKILRDRQAIDPNITFAQVQREVTPFLDSIKVDEILEVAEAAKRGDRVAAEVINAKKMFDDGRIFPVTHALADVDTAANKGLIQAAKTAGNFSDAGRFSERLYGTATYEDIAKQLRNPDEFLEGLTKKYLNSQISGAILRGELGAINELPKNATNIRYIDRALLEEGQLQKALNTARKDRLLADDIAIDMDVLQPLKEQSGTVTGALDGIAQEVFQTAKSNLLAQGTYIGANVITGANNAIMNSGAGLIGDVISAIKSKGELAKNLGIYRRRIQNIPTNPLLKSIYKLNKYTGAGQFQEIDRRVQNALAEVAAHAELRQAGVPYSERLKAISTGDKINLGKAIVDIKRAALINGSKTLLPKSVSDTAFMGNPFWRWQDTATQATYRMIEKHPIMANIALLDVAANIGFDKEMQNRLNLHVDMDKPYVSFKFDPNTAQMKTITSEFVPITTTIKFADFKNQSFAPSMPFFTSIYNAMGGLDKYGRPMKRPDQNGVLTQVFGTTRQVYKPMEGWVPMGGQADEIINASIKSLIGAPNLYNRTVAPILSSVLSPTGQYYQPYDMALLGSYDRQNLGTDAIRAGAPTKGRTATDVIKAFGGMYEQDYIPAYDRPDPRRQRQLMRQHLRQQMREAGEGY